MRRFGWFAVLLLVSAAALAWPTERDEYYAVNGTESVDVQSLSPTPRPKSLGKGSWKAIKIWESGPTDPLASSSSSTSKRASAERVVASHATTSSSSSLLYLAVLIWLFIISF